jgi:peptidylprolyl isomerase
MTQAKIGDTVTVHYTGKLSDGTVFDSSSGGDPLEFTLGEGELIAGFENAVVGMNPGETKTAEIPVDQAYGLYNPDMVIEVDREQMPAELEPEVGQQLQLQQPTGEMIPVVITKVEESVVTLDANHPLAGEDLVFDIQLVAIA